MHTFFHGWRQKTGVLALVMALAAMGAWMRSRVTEDLAYLPFEFQTGDWTITAIGAANESLVLYGLIQEQEAQPRLMEKPISTPVPTVPASDLQRGKVEPFDELSVPPEIARIGETLNLSVPHFDDIPALMFPQAIKPLVRLQFSWVVIPLTLLSAYLLLVPSRKRPPTASQPHA